MARKGLLRDLIKRTKAGEVLAAARLISLIQRGDKGAKKSVSKFPPLGPKVILIGVTGPGGVGKSTLINKLICFFRDEDKKVGVMCCDPVSVSGGVFLGDRLRMQDRATDPEVFIRSLPQYGHFKGVAPEVPYVVKIFGILKKDVIIIETVGVGQENLGFKEQVEIMIYVSSPGLGDEIQLLKGGVIETADIIVVNKADRLGADPMFQNIMEYFGKTKKIYKTNSVTGQGIPELAAGIKECKGEKK